QYHARARPAIKSDAAARCRDLKLLGAGRARGLAGPSVVKAACERMFRRSLPSGLTRVVGTGSPARTCGHSKKPGPCPVSGPVSGGMRQALPPSGGGEVLCRGLSGLAVGHNLEGDFLAFLELVEAGALDRTDVDEHVLAPILRLDESV